jgi:glycerophosphoryl diester phosphodiesterase
VRPIIIAHRTCPRHAPENSLEGIRKAAELGADGVEVDVRRTLDGVPVLMHDRTMLRTTGVPLPTWLLPYRVIRRLRLRGGHEPVPALAEALATLPATMKMAIEIKERPVTGAALAEVRRHGLEQRALIWSEVDEAARYAAREASDMEVSLLRSARSREGLRRFLDDAVLYGARGVSVHWRAVDSQLVAEAHERGLVVYSLAPAIEYTLTHIRAGIDGVITQWPRELAAALRKA